MFNVQPCVRHKFIHLNYFDYLADHTWHSNALDKQMTDGKKTGKFSGFSNFGSSYSREREREQLDKNHNWFRFR